MKNLLALLAALALVFVISPCRTAVVHEVDATEPHFLFDPEEISEEEKESEGHAWEMFDWWYSQRAYPNRLIPKDGFWRAWEDIQQNFSTGTNSFAATSWTSIGPDNVGGRMLSLAIDPTNSNNIWAGAASGGLWKTEVAGEGPNAWNRIETGFPSLSVSAIVTHTTDPQVIYIGTGEISRYDIPLVGTPGARSSYGLGIIKSVDGGMNWSTTGLTWTFDQSRAVLAMKMDQQNPSVLWAATSEGLFKTVDAGTSWTLSHNELMAMDVVIDPLDSNVVYVSHGQLGIPPDGVAGIYKTTDGGANWTLLSGGLPATDFGRTSLTISSDGQTLYAGVTSASAYSIIGLFKTTDKGVSWTNINTTNFTGGQGWYDNTVAVSPVNTNHVLAGGLDVYLSTDGGPTLTQVGFWWKGYGGVVPAGGPEGPSDYVHADQHAIMFDPQTPQTVYVACDGGVFKSLDGGATWAGKNGDLQTTQFYAGFANGTLTQNLALGGLQDNGTLLYRGLPSWDKTFGGDGGWCAIDSVNENLMFEEYVYLRMSRSTDGGDNWSIIHPLSSGSANFIAPFVVPESNHGGTSAWGWDLYGQASAAPTGGGLIQVAGGFTHSLALQADGSIVSWGYDPYGQVSNTPLGTNFTQVAAGAHHSLALRADGSIKSWGSNGGLGGGAVSDTPGGTGFVQIAGGGGFSVALRSDGSIVTWGYDDVGQVSNTPTGTGFTQVAAGVNHALALRSDGSIVSWGHDVFGQVSNSPTGTGFIQVAGGGGHSLALRADTTIEAWGYDGDGQVGSTPVGTGFMQVDGGYHHSVALWNDGSIYSWGGDSDGEVSNTPTENGFTQVVAFGRHSLGLHLNTSTIYAGMLSVEKSEDGGITWFYPDSVTDWNGTPVATIGVAPTNVNHVIAGTGSYSATPTMEVRWSTNGGVSWNLVSAAALPDRYPTDFHYDANDANRVWATFSGYGTGHVWESTDAGASWVDRSANLPDIPAQSVMLDPAYPQTVWVGTDLGIFQSTDGGATWGDFNMGMPIAMITDLTLHAASRTMRASTFGNGVWEIMLIDPPSSPGIPFCYGDGSGVICPCTPGGPGEGCANSTGSGAVLVGSGAPIIANDSFILSVSNSVPGAPGLIIQGTVDFGDLLATPLGNGLLCFNSQKRWSVQGTSSSGAVTYGPNLFSHHPAATPGATVFYQWLFRDPADPCGGVFNLSNAWSTTWQ